MRSKAGAKALIVKREKRGYLALTPEGDFCRLPLNIGEVPVGEEVEIGNTTAGWAKVAALAACILLVLFGWQLSLAILPAAAAYISLDINPSLELAVDAGGQVVKAASLDQEGQQLMQGLELRKKPLNEAIQAIMRAAANQGYITPEGAVLVTLVPVAEEIVPLATDQVARSIEAALQANYTATRVLVTSASEKERREARDLGISTGKYVLVEAAREKGKPSAGQELVAESIGEWEARQGLRAEELLQERARQGKPATVILPQAAKKPARPHLAPGLEGDQGLPASRPAEPSLQGTLAQPRHDRQGSAAPHDSRADKEVLPAKVEDGIFPEASGAISPPLEKNTRPKEIDQRDNVAPKELVLPPEGKKGKAAPPRQHPPVEGGSSACGVTTPRASPRVPENGGKRAGFSRPALLVLS